MVLVMNLPCSALLQCLFLKSNGSSMTAGISYFDTCQILYVKYVCLSVCMQEFSRVSWNGMDCYGTMAWHSMVWFGMVWNGMYVAQCNVVYCDVMYSTVMEWSVGMQQ